MPGPSPPVDQILRELSALLHLCDETLKDVQIHTAAGLIVRTRADARFRRPIAST